MLVTCLLLRKAQSSSLLLQILRSIRVCTDSLFLFSFVFVACVCDDKIIAVFFLIVSDTLSKKRDVWDMKEIRDIVGTEENVTINLLSRVSSDEVFATFKRNFLLVYFCTQFFVWYTVI